MLWLACCLILLAGACLAQEERDFRVNRRTQDTNADPETLLIRCYGRWGCLSIGGPFFSPNRPVSVFPLHPEVLHIKFLLWTRRNPDNFHVLKSRDNGTFALSNFDASRPIKFIVHDFKGSGTMRWIEETAKELLTADNFNVISVDWHVGASPPYSQAVANARMVGVVIADLIKFIEDRFRMSSVDMHIIGHGLGAHVAGYAGENARGLGRITGLDPASGYFENTAVEVRLDATDAKLVDVIHTDIGTPRTPGAGIYQESGHLDFYPNGGRVQPGCYEGIMATQNENHIYPYSPHHDHSGPPYEYGVYKRRRREANGHDGERRRYVNCNHVRAYEIFLESINSDCPFNGYRCNTFRNFTLGACREGCGTDRAMCAPIGMHADEWQDNIARTGSQSIKMYLETGFDEPLCRHHYHVEINTANSIEATRHGNETGSMIIKMTGSKGKTPFQETTTYGPAMFSPGQSFDALLSANNLGRILRLDVQWLALTRENGHSLGHAGHIGGSNSYRYPELYMESIVITNLETGIRSTFCSDPEPLKPGKTRSMFVGGNCDRGFV